MITALVMILTMPELQQRQISLIMRHLSGWGWEGRPLSGPLTTDTHLYVGVSECVLTSSQAVIGGEGRSAPSGLPIRTLTSINISASFLYRSGLSHSLSLSLSLCLSLPSHP